MRILHAHSASSNDVRYAYASGRIRALETTLLGKQRLERLAEAADTDEVIRLLSDTSYAAHLDEIESGYETFLANEERRVLDLVDYLSHDQGVSDLLRLKYDFHNLKVALRERISSRDLKDLYMDLGRYAAVDVASRVKDDQLERLPGPLGLVARRALEKYESSGDPGEADTVVDREMFTHFLKSAEAFGARYIETIVKTWIDLANIRVALRARYLEFAAREVKGLLIEGGTVPLSYYTDTFSLGLDEIVLRFESTAYRRIIELGGAGLEKLESSVPLEREIENNLVSLFRVSRYFTFGLELVLVYALTRQSEIRVLRLIFGGKEQGMAPEAIKERIPDGY
jgi:V/A-type H+-transporting ATPase subunit C